MTSIFSARSRARPPLLAVRQAALQALVLDRGKIAANAAQARGLDVGAHHTGPARQAVEHQTPRVDAHAVAMGLAAVGVITPLRRRHHVAEIFDGARPHQDFPVRHAGDGGEGRRHHQDLHALAEHGAEQFGEAQVVTDGKTEFAEWGIEHHDGIARLDGLRLRIILAGLADVHVEHVHLVVPHHPPAAIVHQQAGGPHFVIGLCDDGDGATHQPHTMLGGLVGEKILDGTFAVLLADLHFVLFGKTHDGEIFRQHDQLGVVILHGAGDEAAGLDEVGADIGPRRHLYGCDAAHGVLLTAETDSERVSCAVAVAAVAGCTPMRCGSTPSDTSQSRSALPHSAPSSLAGGTNVKRDCGSVSNARTAAVTGAIANRVWASRGPAQVSALRIPTRGAGAAPAVTSQPPSTAAAAARRPRPCVPAIPLPAFATLVPPVAIAIIHASSISWSRLWLRPPLVPPPAPTTARLPDIRPGRSCRSAACATAPPAGRPHHRRPRPPARPPAAGRRSHWG